MSGTTTIPRCRPTPSSGGAAGTGIMHETDLFPADAISDLHAIASRIQAGRCFLALSCDRLNSTNSVAVDPVTRGPEHQRNGAPTQENRLRFLSLCVLGNRSDNQTGK
jgi:hypothetical protein